jgi:molybdopterin synthase catalytic subunit
MEIEIQITSERIALPCQSQTAGDTGAVVEFSGVVRGEENGQPIRALEYEAYAPMAERVVREILASLAAKFPCQTTRVIHRTGVVPVGETAIYIRVTARHRAEAFALLAGFMDRLKQDVPIWKVRALT